MPLYEFRCRSCERQFEVLVSMSAIDTVRCPGCSSADVGKLMSSFSSRVKSDAGGYRPTASSSGCSSCSSGNCSSCGHH
ncbi:MAG: zinc ribbon domain-containing protein [Deltaproteobacteria bacterium]|nr:zinc ribbon domain-containing protein [Deltaproteobacteria bacterium]